MSQKRAKRIRAFAKAGYECCEEDAKKEFSFQKFYKEMKRRVRKSD